MKRFEDETNLLCYILVDMSRSMGYGSGTYTKSEYARTLAATLAYFLFTQRDAVGLVTFDEEIADYLPPRHRPGHLRRLMAVLERETARPLDRSRQAAGADRRVGPQARPGRADLRLARAADVLRPKLGYLRSRGHDVVVFRVLDPAEVDFTFAAPGMFQDVEIGPAVVHRPAGGPRRISAPLRRARRRVETRVPRPGRRLRPAARPTGRWSSRCSTCCRRGCGAAGGTCGTRLGDGGPPMSFLTPLYVLGLAGRSRCRSCST